MTKTPYWITALLLLLVIIMPSPSLAIKPMSALELASHCNLYNEGVDNKDAIFCIRYIQGFIDGAIATDQRVMSNVADEYEREENFTERAMRTRIKSRIINHSPTYYAEFCLGEPVQLKEVVEKVVIRLTAEKNQYTLARDFVYQTLRDEYKCTDED